MENFAEAIIRYDGPALANHEMDADDLASALSGLSKLCALTNDILNGKQVSVTLRVRADLDQQCFQVTVQLFQTALENVGLFLDQKPIQDAKNILEWIGLIGGPPLGIFTLYRLLYGKKSESETTTEIAPESNGIVQVIGNNNSINFNSPLDKAGASIYDLADNPRIMREAAKVLEPVNREGYEKLEFESNGVVSFYASKQEVSRMIPKLRELSSRVSSIAVPEGEPPDDEQYESISIVEVRVKRAIFEGNAAWQVILKNKSRETKMCDHEFLEKFQSGEIALIGRTTLLAEIGIPLEGNTIDILKVHKVVPPSKQLHLPRDLEAESASPE